MVDSTTVKYIAFALLGITMVAATAHAEEQKNFTVDVAGTTRRVVAGEQGHLAVHIKPADGYKVNDKGPLRLRLSAKDKLALDATKLARKDAKGKVTSPKFGCGFKAKEEGDDAITIDAMFVICDTAGTVCELKREKVEVAIAITDQ